MGTMNTDIDLQNDPDIPEARQMIIDLVGAHMGPTPKELPQFTNVAFDPILSGDDTDNLRLLIHAVYQAQSLIVSLPTGMTAWVSVETSTIRRQPSRWIPWSPLQQSYPDSLRVPTTAVWWQKGSARR